MKSITHSLQFVTELDETNSTAITLLSLPENLQVLMLESMLKDLMSTRIQPILNELNEHNSYATLRLAD